MAQLPLTSKKAGYVIRDQSAPYFMTWTIVDWVDVFTKKIYRDILLNSFQFYQKNKGLILYGYVIMSNHVHLLARSEDGKLSDLVRDIKKFSAQKILDQISKPEESRADWMLKRFEFSARRNTKDSKFNFWQSDNHPEEIFSNLFMLSKLNYIHMNPVNAGLVFKASDYLYSSASNYVGKEGLIPITLVDMPTISPTTDSKLIRDISCW